MNLKNVLWLLALGGLAACAATPATEASKENAVVHVATEQERSMVRSTDPLAGEGALLYVNGLGCPLCATNIDRQFNRAKEIASAEVDLGAGTVRVMFMPDRAHPSPARLRGIVEDAGFTLVKLEPL